ncbi:hypothetical protein C5E10_06205 [Pseudoclavibacter sp. RFBG4]|uniref:hypothetical protein n=1 Tax=Pseudoclavibacter sp. RFBG4 TaxID=2080575 RepID=UPI000CE7229A|nr:hypothetical protein [Pseudoclavibacter sp. RFBG4]PPG35180.1 hypothetical protein C5E10_06205 [Pseudoclavibacter sp. RFBG4]
MGNLRVGTEDFTIDDGSLPDVLAGIGQAAKAGVMFVWTDLLPDDTRRGFIWTTGVPLSFHLDTDYDVFDEIVMG